MREIKFRWLNEDGEMEYRSLEDMAIQDRAFDMSQEYRKSPLMQYTGLKDKNGKEIYEGDIVQFSFRSYLITGEVIFTGGSWGISHSNVTDYLSDRVCEVIGNTYENPELLK